MKFGKQLAGDRYRQWEDKYLDYKRGKIIAKDASKALGRGEEVNHDDFVNWLKAEENKMSEFYAAKASAIRTLHDTYEQSIDKLEADDGTDAVIKLEALQLSRENKAFLNDIGILENYIFLNHVAWRKIVKKYNKSTNSTAASSVSKPAMIADTTNQELAALKKKALKRADRTKKRIVSVDADKALLDQTRELGLNDSQSGLDSTALSSRDMSQFSTRESMDRPPMQYLTVSFSGPDRPGVSNALLRSAATYHAEILDIHQFAVRDVVTVVIVVGIDLVVVDKFIKDVYIAGRIHGHEVDFDIVDSDYRIVPPTQAGDRYVVTLLSRRLTPKALSKVTQTLTSYNVNIETVKRLNEGSKLTAVELLIQPIELDAPQLSELKKDLLDVSRAYGVDVSLQVDNVSRWAKRLVVFDMDSTLIQMEVIDEIAKRYGVGDKVKDITHRAMNGELDFNASLRERVGLLKDCPVSVLDDINANLLFTPGAKELCSTLKALGFKMAVISGGFIYIAEQVKNYLGLDYAFANRLEVDRMSGTLTGRTVGPVVNGARKADLLNLLAMQEGITAEQVIAIGDGANDLPMLSEAGVGIAFNAKPRVQEEAEYRINQKDLRSVLYMLGLADVQIQGLSKMA